MENDPHTHFTARVTGQQKGALTGELREFANTGTCTRTAGLFAIRLIQFEKLSCVALSAFANCRPRTRKDVASTGWLRAARRRAARSGLVGSGRASSAQWNNYARVTSRQTGRFPSVALGGSVRLHSRPRCEPATTPEEVNAPVRE